MNEEVKRPIVLVDTLADAESALAILRRVVKLSKFMKIEVSTAGASAAINFQGRIMNITDAEAELLTRLRAE